MSQETNSKIELKKMLLAMVIPASFMFLAWMVFLLEYSLNISFSQYGLRPKNLHQWYGILTMPFLHGGVDHILANTISFIVLGSMLFYFNNNKAIIIFILTYFISGIFTWIIARNNIHIGASAMIYAFAAYLFTTGIIGKNIKRMAVTLIVIFFYGSMIWGMVPLKLNISWEGHLAGFLTGALLATIFTPPNPPSPFEEDDNNEEEEDKFYLIDENETNKENLLN